MISKLLKYSYTLKTSKSNIIKNSYQQLNNIIYLKVECYNYGLLPLHRAPADVNQARHRTIDDLVQPLTVA